MVCEDSTWKQLPHRKFQKHSYFFWMAIVRHCNKNTTYEKMIIMCSLFTSLPLEHSRAPLAMATCRACASRSRVSWESVCGSADDLCVCLSAKSNSLESSDVSVARESIWRSDRRPNSPFSFRMVGSSKKTWTWPKRNNATCIFPLHVDKSLGHTNIPKGSRRTWRTLRWSVEKRGPTSDSLSVVPLVKANFLSPLYARGAFTHQRTKPPSGVTSRELTGWLPERGVFRKVMRTRRRSSWIHDTMIWSSSSGGVSSSERKTLFRLFPAQYIYFLQTSLASRWSLNTPVLRSYRVVTAVMNWQQNRGLALWMFCRVETDPGTILQ